MTATIILGEAAEATDPMLVPINRVDMIKKEAKMFFIFFLPMTIVSGFIKASRLPNLGFL
jgi:hypothetical protein